MWLAKKQSTNAEWLMKFLVHTYFIGLRSILIIHDSRNISTLRLDFMEGVVNALKQPPFQKHFVIHWINAGDWSDQQFYDNFLLQVELGCEGYISLLPNTSLFLSGKYYATERSVLRLKDKIFLFLSDGENPRKVLQNDILQFYPNHLLVTAGERNSFNFWTQKFVGLENNNQPILVNTLFANTSFKKNKNLFLEKLNNGFGREMKISALTYIPYIMSTFTAEGQGNVDSIDSGMSRKNVIYEGSEANLVLEFCKTRNYTPKIVPYGNDNWGGIYKNGSSNGMIGSVYRKETEFGIGCYYNWYNDEFETSFTIAKSAVTLLAPAPRHYPPYLTAILPLTTAVWCLILISIIVSSLILYGLRLFTASVTEKNSFHIPSYMLSLMEIFAIFSQQSFANNTKLEKYSTRLFLASLLIACVTLENAYSGNLKSLLTIPFYTNPIDTAKKFATSNLKWGAPAPAWVLSISKSNISFEQLLAKNFEIRRYQEFRNLSFSMNYGLGIERLHSGSYSFGTYIRQDAINYLIVLKDDIFFEYTRGFSIRGWPLMDHFNMFILWILEHGLFHIWERKMVARYLDTKTEKALLNLESNHKNNNLPVVLNISHLSGHLCVLGLGYSTAVIAFVYEILISKFNKVTRNRETISALIFKDADIARPTKVIKKCFDKRTTIRRLKPLHQSNPKLSRLHPFNSDSIQM